MIFIMNIKISNLSLC